MAEVLVLAEHDGETVKKVTGELLTLARQFGEPAAVWIGAGAEGGRERLAEFGAAKVYVADGSDVDGLRRRPGGRGAGRAGRRSSPRRPCCSPRPARARKWPGGWRSRSVPG